MSLFIRVLQVLLSPTTAVLCLITMLYVVVMKSAGFVSSVGGGEEAVAVVFAPHLHAFLLGPVWFALCAVRSQRAQRALVLIRSGSASRWWRRECAFAALESAQMILSMSMAVAMLLVAGQEFTAAREYFVANWEYLAGQVSSYALFLVAVRATFAALALLRIPALGVALVIEMSVIGVITASNMPMPTFVTALSWLTWMNPISSAALVGSSFAGIVVSSGWLLCVDVALVLCARGRRVGGVAYLPLIVPGFIVLQALLIWGAAAVEPVSVSDAFAVIYHGPMIDMVGVPLIPVFLALLLFFGAPVMMLKEFDETVGGWLELVLIRAGSAWRWAITFVGRWLSIAVIVLVCAPVGTFIAWLVLPDSVRADRGEGVEHLLILFRFLVVGVLQVCFYMFCAFAVAWVARRALPGLVAVVLMMVGGIINPLFGGALPTYLNGLARVEQGWPGAIGDAARLALASCGIFLFLAIHIHRAAQVPHPSRRSAICPRSTSSA